MTKKSAWYTKETRKNICSTQATQFDYLYAHVNGNMRKFWLEKFMFNRESHSRKTTETNIGSS